VTTISIATSQCGRGYWIVARNGVADAYGDAYFFEQTGAETLKPPAVGFAATPSGQGYWVATANGGVFTYGEAPFFGSMQNQPLNQAVVGMASTPTGDGYWLTAGDGGVFSFGDAGFFGSMGGRQLNQPVVGIARTPTGQGYWLVAADGGVFTFGDAGFFGSLAGQALNRPVVGMAATPSGQGYWMAAGDGGVFAFGDAEFFGSTGGQPPSARVVGMAATRTGRGYRLVTTNAEVIPFGDAQLFDPAVPPPSPWAILLCHPSDVLPAPGSSRRYVDYFTEAGCGAGGAHDYWDDLSYGACDLRGSRVFNWLDLGHTSAELLAIAGPAQRQQAFDWGMAAARNSDVDLTAFAHKIVALNVNADQGAVGGGGVFTYADGREFEPTFMFHEMGHELGLAHSFGDGRPGSYCDVFDIMSAMNVQSFVDAFGRRSGPTLNAISREWLGWMPAARVRDLGAVDRGETVLLAPLNRPEASGFLMLKFQAPSRDPAQTIPSTYSIEFRERKGWDRGFAAAHVPIHEVRTDGLVRLVTGHHTGCLEAAPHAEFVAPGQAVVVRLIGLDESAHAASVRIWRLPLRGQRSIRIASIDSDPPGNDVELERVTIHNDTQVDVDVTGWTLRDAARHRFIFPSFRLRSGFGVAVWTKAGIADDENLFWGRRAAVWNNTGDTAVLSDSSGMQVAQFSY
jgi:hypothetical protein